MLETIKGRMDWMDNLRVIGIVGVILIHVSARIVTLYGSIPANIWWIGNIYDGSLRFCVPLFVMLTGALLLPREQELAIFLKRRLVRIVLPLVFWSCIYIVFNFSLKILYREKISIPSSIKWAFVQLLQGSSFHLWYVYMIIGIYLFIPIIGRWVRNASKKEILYFLCIWSFTLFLNLPFLLNYKPAVDLTYFSGYIGYLVLGYYITSELFYNQKITNALSILLIISGVVVTVIGTYFISAYKGKFSADFYNHLSLNCLFESSGVFLLFKNKTLPIGGLAKLRNFISSYSYGIYLVHLLVLFFLTKIRVDWKLIHPLIGSLLTTLICLTISCGIIYVVNKLPYGRYISG